jgi:hypothetical protein
MIRQVLTTAFCAALFFLIVFVLPAGAVHKTVGTPYVCTSLEDAMETVRLQMAGAMEIIVNRAMFDEDFKCFFLEDGARITIIELVYEYIAYGARRGLVRVQTSDGSLAYTFGTMQLINTAMHQEGA